MVCVSYSPPSKTKWLSALFRANLSPLQQIKLLFEAGYSLAWYKLKQLFPSVSVRVAGIHHHFGESLLNIPLVFVELFNVHRRIESTTRYLPPKDKLKKLNTVDFPFLEPSISETSRFLEPIFVHGGSRKRDSTVITKCIQ